MKPSKMRNVIMDTTPPPPRKKRVNKQRTPEEQEAMLLRMKKMRDMRTIPNINKGSNKKEEDILIQAKNQIIDTFENILNHFETFEGVYNCNLLMTSDQIFDLETKYKNLETKYTNLNENLNSVNENLNSVNEHLNELIEGYNNLEIKVANLYNENLINK